MVELVESVLLGLDLFLDVVWLLVGNKLAFRAQIILLKGVKWGWLDVV